MSRSAALALEVDSSKPVGRAAAGLRVSQPGDAHEAEADRVADTVARGGRVAGWSLSPLQAGGVQRQATPEPVAVPAAATQTADMGKIAGKVAEALAATPEGKKALAAVTGVIGTPAGAVVTGATAIGVVAALAKSKTPLPAQLPAIPLKPIKDGLSVKVTWTGPVNAPTGASLTLSYQPKAAEAKPKTGVDSHALAEDLAKFRAGLQPASDLPGPRVGPVKTPERRMMDQWSANQLKAMGSSLVRPLPSMPQGVPMPGTTPSATGLTPAPAPAAAPEAKKEEAPVHRKAESAAPVSTGSGVVDSVVRSGGRPLDAATRRDMESRIGFDFSHVRVHTDSRAGASAQALNASAYTVGSNVVFAPGRFAPQSGAGRRLLAHELTHVVQQGTTPAKAHPVLRPAPMQVQRKWEITDIPGSGYVIEKIKANKAYPLICTLMGRDLFTDEPRDRNPTTITHGILGLFEGGEDLFQKLVKAKTAVAAAWAWLQGELDRHKLTEAGLEDVLERAKNAFHILHLEDSKDAILKIVREPMDSALDLAGDIAKKVMDFVLESLLKAVGEKGQEIFDFFARARSVLGSIAADPLKFAGNLFKAVKEGFEGFGTRILEHLGKGLKEWIFQELNLSGVEMPADLSFASMFKLLMQTLGLTYPQIRPQLVEALQDMGGETVVVFFEQSASLIADVVKAGPKGGLAIIKEKIVAEAGEIFNSLVDGIKTWVRDTIAKKGIELVVKLASPVGEIVAAIEGIYHLVTFVIDKAAQLKKLGETILNALADIVAGNTAPAAKKVEDTLSDSISVLLHFLAVELGLGDMGKQIRKIIDDIRAPIKKVIGKVLKAIVDKGKKLWEDGKAAFTKKLEEAKEWWTRREKFDFGDEEHEIAAEGDGEHPEVFVYSTRTELGKFLDARAPRLTPEVRKQVLGLAKGLKWKSGGLVSMSSTASSYTNFQKLVAIMKGLRSKKRPQSVVDDMKPKRATYGSADWAEAFLSTNLTEGTPTSGDKTDPPNPPAWEDLGYWHEKETFVRGHLISNELGGHAVWTNLMPITNGANGRMERKVESKLKAATKDKSNWNMYHYEVHAKYRPTAVPTLPPSPTKAQEKQRADLARQRLVALEWKVEDAFFNPISNKWNKTNRVPRDEKDEPLTGEARAGSEKAMDH